MFSLKELSEETGISEDTLLRLFKKHNIEPERKGRHFDYAEDAYDLALANKHLQRKPRKPSELAEVKRELQELKSCFGKQSDELAQIRHVLKVMYKKVYGVE